MNQKSFNQSGATVGQLSGPWWLNDVAISETEQEKPQEAFFRLEFSAASMPTLRLAAGDYYQVWLNGVWIGNGPVRAPRGHLTVDEWVLSLASRHEKNTICIQVFWEGVFTFDHVRGTPGLWYSLSSAEGEIAAEFLASGKTGRIASHRFSHQRGWIEEIDGRARVAGWPHGPWQAADWQKPVLRTKNPPVVLEARDIKPFRTVPTRAHLVSFAGSGDLAKRTKHRGMFWSNVPGFEAGPDIPSNVMQEEALEPAQAADENLSALTAAGSGIAVLGPDTRGLDRTVQLNFGKLVTGTLSLTLEAPAGTVVDFGWSEGRWHEPDMGHWAASAQPGGSAPSQELNDSRQGMRYVCSGGGVETFHSLYLLSCHNLRLAFRSPDKKAAIRLHDCTLFFRGYPIAAEGGFSCSDAALNRIYDAALYTASCSVDDVYMDCPGRERGGYPNDSYFASLGFLDLTGDIAFDRRFLRQFFDSQEPLGGAVAPLAPSDSSRWRGWGDKVYVITGHVIFWLIQCERHLRLFGDAKLKEEWRPALAKAFAALGQYRNAEGLLENVPWDTYLDWSRHKSGHVQTGDNFIYALALQLLGELYQNQEWLAQGRETAETIERLAWNPGRGLYADTVERGQGGLACGSTFSTVINYIALWTGLAEPKHAAHAWRQLRDFRPLRTTRTLFDYETDLVRANLVGLMYRFGYMARRGEFTDLIADLREAYEPMFARGQATLGEHLGYQGSLCHGYNAYLVYLFNRHFAGIELPEQPGSLIRIRPRSDVLSYCQARTCWMQGYVQVWWSRVGNELEVMVSLPPGQQGELVLGGQPVAFSGSLHTKVEISPGI